MTVMIALLRGVNVGGHHKLPMKTLRALFEAEGATDVSTYIQSGNVVFRATGASAASLEKKLGVAIKSEVGFEPDILIFGRAALSAVIKNNPFAGSNLDPSKLFIVFLKERADKNALKSVEAALANGERAKAVGSAVYFDAPSGVGRSKAAEKLARLFSHGTMQNWRTCLKLEEMAGALAQNAK